MQELKYLYFKKLKNLINVLAIFILQEHLLNNLIFNNIRWF